VPGFFNPLDINLCCCCYVKLLVQKQEELNFHNEMANELNWLGFNFTDLLVTFTAYL